MMNVRRSLCHLVLLTVLAVFYQGATARADPQVTVFAAASLKNALDDVAARFETAGGANISLSYGGSSALARQIQYGAPAQIFLSANASWMDMLENDDLLLPDTRVNLLANRLVLISGPQTDVTLTIENGMDLTTALGGGRLAIALVDAVPAGIYGRAALQSLGVWDQAKDHIAQTDNVSASLRLVAAGETPLGIVYATDAAAQPLVRVIGVFPAASHPPILYPVAEMAQGSAKESRAFFEFLTGAEAHAIFERHGFISPDKAGS